MRWVNSENGIGISVEEVPGRKAQGLFIIVDGTGFKVGNVTDKEAFENTMNEMLEPFMTDPNR